MRVSSDPPINIMMKIPRTNIMWVRDNYPEKGSLIRLYSGETIETPMDYNELQYTLKEEFLVLEKNYKTIGIDESVE